MQLQYLRLTGELLAADKPRSVDAHIAEIRRDVLAAVGNVKKLHAENVERARAWLLERCPEIRLTPAGAGRKAYFIAEGSWSLLPTPAPLLGALPDSHRNAVQKWASPTASQLSGLDGCGGQI